jgi:Tn3 transposase DDE domain
MLSLHLLQLTLVYINTLMIQQILAEPAWANRLNATDLRGITPLVYGHVNPYGSFHLDLHSRLPIDPHHLARNPSEPRCSSATINSSDELL